MGTLYSGYFVLVLLCTILVQIVSSTEDPDGFFYGGSISYKLEEIAGKKIAHVELITGWELGKGPCGKDCSKKDVGTLTNARRTQKDSSTGISMYFGNFTTDYTIKNASSNKPTTAKRPLNDIVRTNYSEWVIAVSETAKWEQELMKFSFEMEDAAEDVNFDGKYWRPLNQGRNLTWHFQAHLDHSLRSDTGAMNNCPQVFTKSYYRVKLDKITIIKIPMVDPEGDIVRCDLGKFVEGGGLPEAPGVKVHNESDTSICKVSINSARLLGYGNDNWIAVSVSVRDYNRGAIQFGDDVYQAGAFSLSSSNAQFGVQILENLVTPEFVAPSKKGDHMFIVYAGSTWSTKIYAQAPINTTIDEFIPLGRSMEKVTVSDTHEDTSRDRVMFTTMSWAPDQNDLGQHILCIRAVDDTGVDTDELRCFTIEVREDTFNYSSAVVTGKPYFINIPKYDQFVNCKMGATCLIPIFVKSNVKVSKIEITEVYTDEATVGNIETFTADNGDVLYKTILSFTHSEPGVEKICLTATDIINATSDTVCISPEIEFPDPCISTPCRNSASCKSDPRTGKFVCVCVSTKFYGKLCEKKHDVCNPSPCVHGTCYDNILPFYCLCTPVMNPPAYTGLRCEINRNDCTKDSCNATTGTCRDLVGGTTCDCYQRYSGDKCNVDNCPDENPASIECHTAGCYPDPCSGHGVCSKGGVCTCRMGYNSDPNCTSEIGSYAGVTGVKFVPPSPMDKSQFTCFVNSNAIKPCHIAVFVASSNGVTPTLNIETTSELMPTSTIEKQQKSTVLQGINNVFSADVVIRGTVKQMDGHYVCVTANGGSDVAELCLELNLVIEPKQDPAQNSATIKFLEPTPVEGSILVGYINETYTVILYTPGSTPCKNVIPTTAGVTVFPAEIDGTGACVTEAAFVLNSSTTQDICFHSAKTDFQKRCFIAKGLNQDNCSTSPCQNKGHCFPSETTGFRCICQEKYKGQKCEEGPCPVNGCQNEAYCKVNDGVQACICKAGFTGSKCEFKSSDKKSEITFTGMAKPKLFQCVIYQPCSVALLLTEDKQSGQRPEVMAGYVSPSIKLGDIDVTERGSSGSFQANIGLKATEVGIKDVCIQSIGHNGVNKDELCFKVNVITEVSTLYGFKDRPHFIYPSVPDDAEVECPESEPCHLIYHVTPGQGNDKQCIAVVPSESSDIKTHHVFTSCEPCTPGQPNIGNCSIDVSIINDGTDVGKVKHFCLEINLINSDTSGEERCFDLSVISKIKNNEKKGCQVLQCKHGGFCDGHIPDKPTCFCKNGFSGNDCNQEGGVPTVAGSHTQSFLGDLAIPSEIKCKVGQTCPIQFKVVSAAGKRPEISVGYSDPRLSTGEPVSLVSSSSSNTLMGYVNVHPSEKGTFHVCLQTNDNSKTVEELCVVVQVSDASQEQQDTSKPHFTNPTLPMHSTVLCQENTPCHLDLYFTKGDDFGFPGKCPSLTEAGNTQISGLHMFTPVYDAKSCTSDVTFTLAAAATPSLCFQIALPGKKGENRCFTIRAVSDITNEVSSPCTGITCAHGGKCVADFSSSQAKHSCVCPLGFSGDTCGTTENQTNLPGVKNVSSTMGNSQHFDGTTGVPKNVKCDQVNPCCIVIPYYGDKSQMPLLGFQDSAITVKTEQAITPDPSKPQLQHFQTVVTGPPGAKHRMCYQTTSNGTREGLNIDEICFEVEFTAGGTSNSLLEPKFTNSLSQGSSISCQPKTTCHIPIQTEQKPGGVCEQVKECGKGVTGTYVFKTTAVGDKCITDVSLKTGENANTEKLCLSAGTGGEKRDILVVTEKLEEYGPCQKKHCMNGGFCNSTTISAAVCACAAGYTGTTCENNIATTPTTTTEATTTTSKASTSSATTITTPTSVTTSTATTRTTSKTTSTPATSTLTAVTSTTVTTPTKAASSTTVTTPTKAASSTTVTTPTKAATSTIVTTPTKATSTTTVTTPTKATSTPTVTTPTVTTPTKAASSTTVTTPTKAASSTTVTTPTKAASTTIVTTPTKAASSTTVTTPTKAASSTTVTTPTKAASSTTVTTPTKAASTTTVTTPTKAASITTSSTTVTIPRTMTAPTKAESTAASTITMTPKTSRKPNLLAMSTSNTATISQGNITGQCDNKKAKKHAEKIVKTGYASCFCFVHGKKVHVIKKRPVAQKEDMFKAAGFGAGGMVGTMLVGTVVYVIVSKVRQPAARRQQSTRRPSGRRPVSPRVHPHRKPGQEPAKPQLNF